MYLPHATGWMGVSITLLKDGKMSDQTVIDNREFNMAHIAFDVDRTFC